MLGKLAKWLKILGFDAVFFSKIEDEELMAIAQNQNRVLLTRDTGILERAGNFDSLLIDSENWREQAKQVLDHFDIWEAVKPYSRCIECNTLLKEISKERAKNLVTPFVYKTADTFALCPSCERVFWRGTHLKDMEFKIGELLKKKTIPFDDLDKKQ
jgi:uncharacterized protein with PIN domain